MYFLLILFFASLLGITFMIGRKLVLLQNGKMLRLEETPFGPSLFEEWKVQTSRNVKKHSYVLLVLAIRFHVRASNTLKNAYAEMKDKIKESFSKKSKGEASEKREVSGFLKMISEYKQKVREIKHKIREEENL